MAAFDDFLPCPALDRWLLPRFEGKVVGAWVCAPTRRWKAPRSVRRMLAKAGVEASPSPAEPGSLDVLVVVSPLPGSMPAVQDEVWHGLRAGGSVIDLATAERRAPSELVRPWAHAQRLRDAAATRVREWLERGAFGPEQWVPVEPAGVVVTMADKAVLPGRPA